MFKTGDIIFTSKRSIIVRFMRLFQSDPVYWGHVLVAKNSEVAWEAGLRLQEYSIPDKLKSTKHYKVARPLFLTEECQKIMIVEASKLVGNRYSFWRLFLCFLDKIFCTHWFTSTEEREALQVCSSYVAWIYYKSCGYLFNKVHWKSCDPDDIDNDIELNTDRWQIVEERKL